MPEIPLGDDVIITLLADEQLLQIQGPDARQVLQGQTTADFASAEPGTVLGGAFCDVKGRVLADFLALVVDEDRVFMRVHASLAERLLEHLSKYLAFSKSTLGRTDWCVLGVQPHPEEKPAKGSEANASAIAIDLERGGGFALQRDANTWEWWRPAPPADASTDSALWYRAALLRGEARLTAPTWGLYLPQDLNFDLTGWVNFKKGCYTGQEIIARLHWRGNPKRRLHQGTCQSRLAPQAGAKLLVDGRTVGSVINSVATETGYLVAVETAADGIPPECVLDQDGASVNPVTA